MKNNLKFTVLRNYFNRAINWLVSEHGVFALILMALVTLLWLLGSDGEVTMATAIIAGTSGGKHVVDGPLTTSLTNEISPELLRNEIDERIVKIRPTSTPVDQLSRCAGARHSGSMVVDYYSVDTKPTETTLQSDYEEDSSAKISGGFQVVTIYTDNDDIFEPSETILVPEVNGYDAEGTNYNGSLVLYVVSKIEGGGINILAVNGKMVGGIANVVPSIPAGAKLVRMGRAAAELDVQTAQFEALPVKSQNNCQIFKAQVEQSTFQKIANKEVGWDFSDQEEVAIIDMRLGMEKNFLFGTKARVYDPVKHDEILLTGGIWNQATREFGYTKGTFTTDTIVDLCRAAFTSNAGSNRKILIGGTGLIEAINKMDYTKVISAGDTVTKWGITFNELRSKFGSLYVLHSEVFDQCGHYDDGFVLDPEYITKYCHVPFRTEKLDLRRSGVRNTDAIVITEASCLVLRYPQAHLRVIAV